MFTSTLQIGEEMRMTEVFISVSFNLNYNGWSYKLKVCIFCISGQLSKCIILYFLGQQLYGSYGRHGEYKHGKVVSVDNGEGKFKFQKLKLNLILSLCGVGSVRQYDSGS